MIPLITATKPAFQKLILGMAGSSTSSDSALFPDRKNMSKKFKSRYSYHVNFID